MSGQRRSCLEALAPKQQRDLGLSNPKQPVIRLEFLVGFLHETDQHPQSKNPPPEVVRKILVTQSTEPDDWTKQIVSAIPSWLQLRLVGRHLKVVYANTIVRVYEHERRQEDQAAVLLAHFLTDVMVRAYEVKARAIDRLPSYRRLRSVLWEQCLASTQHLLRVGGFEGQLMRAKWLCRLLTFDTYGACTPAELAVVMQPVNDSARNQNSDWLHLPVLGSASTWQAYDPYARRADMYLDLVADVMLRQIAPRVMQRLGVWQRHDPEALVVWVQPLLPWRPYDQSDPMFD
jgi:hypothetical protein